MSKSSAIFGGPPRHHHLAISVSNLDKAIEWYGETLGFKKTHGLERPHLAAAILENSGYCIELIELKGSEANPLAWKSPDEQMQTRGMTHYAFAVPNLEETVKALREAKVRFAVEPTSIEELQVRFAHIYDLDGNLLEFAQKLPAPAAAAKESAGGKSLAGVQSLVVVGLLSLGLGSFSLSAPLQTSGAAQKMETLSHAGFDRVRPGQPVAAAASPVQEGRRS